MSGSSNKRIAPGTCRRIHFYCGLALFFLLAALHVPSVSAQSKNGLVADWRFDEGHGSVTRDSAGSIQDTIQNNFQWVKGVRGRGLKFDGFTTLLERPPAKSPKLGSGFTISAWVALQSYPWNWVALVDQDRHRSAGYYFGIDAEGHLALEVAVGGKWQTCQSQAELPLNRWTHIAATYDSAAGIRLYLNGKPAGSLSVTGVPEYAADTPLRIGRNIEDMPPVALVRKRAAYPASYSLDGILDELQIYSRALSPVEAARFYQPELAQQSPELKPRHWPAIPFRPNHLSAAYTQLKLYPEWDALWRSGPSSDVVVGFKELPVHYVFWRGANFGPGMVTENGIWFGDQSFESSTSTGTAEHMNDKHDLRSYIAIVENTNARVVLHWHYGLVDVLGNYAGVDPATGWGDSADEYIYIYPDGIAVRYGTVHGLRYKYSFTEPTLLLEPGKKPEDYLSLQAATIANEDGEQHTYSWDPVPPPFPFPSQPAGANLALVHSKSAYRPFYIYREGTVLGPYGWAPEVRLDYSHFPVWDHWPVNQIPSDGRFALHADHFASAAIMSPNPNATWTNEPDGGKSTAFLFGLTSRSIEYLSRVDRSWLHPASIEVRSPGFSAMYDPNQRAYLLKRIDATQQKTNLNFIFQASESSPAMNPAFVIENWGEHSAQVLVDGNPVSGSDVQMALIHRLSGTDLVLWLRRESSHPFSVQVLAQDQSR